MTIYTLGHCLICYNSDDPGRNPFESVNLHESRRKNGEVCHRFCTLVSRYLPLISSTEEEEGHFQPEKTIKTKLTMSLTHVCDECFPVLETFCKMYDNWQRLQLNMNLKLEEISRLMEQADEMNNKRDHERVPAVTDRRDLEFKLRTMGETMEEIHKFRNSFKVAVGLKARSIFPRVVFERIGSKNGSGSDDDGSESEEHDDLFTPVKPAKKIFTLNKGFQNRIPAKMSADHCKWFKCSICQMYLNDIKRMEYHVKLKHFDTWRELERNAISTKYKNLETKSSKEVKRKKSTNKSGRSGHRHPDSEEVLVVEETPSSSDDDEEVTQEGSRKRKRRNKTLSYSIGLVHKFREKEQSKARISYKQRKTARESSRFSSSKENNVRRPYRCKFCVSAFKNKHELAAHLRVHTGECPFGCLFCAKSFTQITNLDNHLRTHTKEKPFKCKTCKKEFTQVTNLVFHERVHSNVRPYRCKFCGRKFAQISNWNAHQNSH